MKKRGYGKRGWALIIYMFLLYFCTIAMVNSVNIMAPFLSATRGWNAAAITSTYTWAGLVAVILQFALATWLIKHSYKKTALVFGLIFILASILFGFVGSMWQYVLLMIVIKMAQVGWGLPTGYMVSNWFPTRQGTVMGLTTFGVPLAAGFGMAIMAALLGKGMFASYLPFIVIAVVVLLIQQIFLADNPEQVGCYPDNNPDLSKADLEAQLAEQQKLKAECPWTVKRVLSCCDAWFFVIPLGFIQLGAVGFMTQISSVLIAVDAAFYEQFGVMVLTGVSVVACIGSYICGVLDEKFGTKTAIFVTSVLMVAACGLSMTGNLTCTLIAMLFLAVFMGGGSNYMISGVVRYWKRSGYGNVVRVLLPICDILSSLGPILIAYIAMTRLGYTGSFLTIGVLGILGAILVLFMKPGRIEAKEAVYKQTDAAAKR